MATYDSDDALGDLLSEGSNDSFFEEPKVLAKRASLTKTPDKKAIADLFGLEDDKPKEKATDKIDWLGLGEDKPKPIVQTQNIQRNLPKTISFEKDDDILDTMGLTDKKPEAPVKIEPNKKSALMESIFGPSKQAEQSTSVEDILKESKLMKQKSDEAPVTAEAVLQRSASHQNLVKQKSDEAPPKSAPQVQGYTPVEGRRSRHLPSSSNVRDPLGLFSNEPSKEVVEPRRQPVKAAQIEKPSSPVRVSDMKTKSAPNIKDMPGWLGGSPVKTHKSETTIQKTVEAPEAPNDEDKFMAQTLFAQQQLATSHIEYQNTSIALQQQESQLLMALQLKKYEENLAEMQRKQQEVLVKQEQQFNSLLEKQFAKQQIMENNMRLQQERINGHIQMLISQPPVAGTLNADEAVEDSKQLKKTGYEENSRLYEEMIATLKQRQHEEIFLLNESYKKQITLLENSLESVESRLKTEFTSLSEQFQSTLEQLKNDHEAEIGKYKRKLEEASQFHANEIKLIRDNNSRIVEEIKYEYSNMIENLKQMKQTESSLIENAGSYTRKLDNTAEVLEVNSKVLGEIRSKLEGDYTVLSMAREESLKAKEEEIKLTRIALDKARESTETERAQLMGLVRTLELKLVEQSQNTKEERWALQQAAAVLAARSAAFEREIEFTRNALEREKDQIKTLKETMLTEQEKLTLQLTEEKLALLAEKARVETSAKLTQSFDSQKARTEIDAALRVAKEATELTDREREELHKKQSEVEIMKRNLTDKEKKLRLKEKELEEVREEAERRLLEGTAAISEAKTLEVKYGVRLKEIQGQLASLTAREKKLAEEKIAVSKERLALHTKFRQVKKCSLCVSDLGQVEDELVEQNFSPRTIMVTHPDILKLRYEINEERLQLEDS